MLRASLSELFEPLVLAELNGPVPALPNPNRAPTLAESKPPTRIESKTLTLQNPKPQPLQNPKPQHL